MGRKQIRVYVGDSSRRVSIQLPPSLASLISKIRAIHKVQDVQLWLDYGANGRRPGRGRERVEDEADFRTIVDEDVVIFLTDGQIVEPTPQFVALFDGITTYIADYTDKGFPPKRPPANVSRGYPLPAFAAPGAYRTTYGDDYVHRQNLPETDHPGRWFGDEPAPFEGTTTHRADYIPWPLTKKQADNGIRKYRPSSAPARRPPTSTYAADYMGGGLEERGRPFVKEMPDLPPGAPWRNSEYRDAFVPKRGAAPRPESREGWRVDGPAMPDMYGTTHRRDYIKFDDSRLLIHTEPLHHIEDPGRKYAAAAGRNTLIAG